MEDKKSNKGLAHGSSQVPLSEAMQSDEVQLHERARKGDALALNALVLKYTPLVKQIIARVVRGKNILAHIEYQDLVQAGMLGLVQAITSDQLVKGGGTFYAYARIRIRGSIIDALRQNSSYDQRHIEGMKAMEVSRTALERKLLRKPTSREWYDELSPEYRTHFALLRAYALDGKFSPERSVDDDTGSLIDLFRELQIVYESLPKRERMMFDLLSADQSDSKTQRVLALELGISVGTIKTHKNRLIKKIRTRLAEKLNITI